MFLYFSGGCRRLIYQRANITSEVGQTEGEVDKSDLCVHTNNYEILTSHIEPSVIWTTAESRIQSLKPEHIANGCFAAGYEPIQTPLQYPLR